VIPGFIFFYLENFTSRKKFAIKKPAQNFSVAGFTIRSLMPLVTTLGLQIITSTPTNS